MDFQNIADMFLCVKEYRQKSSAECRQIKMHPEVLFCLPGQISLLLKPSPKISLVSVNIKNAPASAS